MLNFVKKYISYYVTGSEEFENHCPERPSCLGRQRWDLLDVEQLRMQIYQYSNILNVMKSS